MRVAALSCTEHLPIGLLSFTYELPTTLEVGDFCARFVKYLL